MDDPKFFLGEGRFTRRGRKIRNLKNSILNENCETDKLEAFTQYVSGLKRCGRKEGLGFRKRNANKIIKSGKVCGCTEVALAFMVLCREAGIPVRYVETLRREGLKDFNPDYIQGHVFTDVFVDDVWRAYDPIERFVEGDSYHLGDSEYIELGKGLDFSELYVKEKGIYRTRPINLNSIRKLLKLIHELNLVYNN